jgi:hypothetical protein
MPGDTHRLAPRRQGNLSHRPSLCFCIKLHSGKLYGKRLLHSFLRVVSTSRILHRAPAYLLFSVNKRRADNKCLN